MEKNKKKQYVPPECFLCDARVEKGFAGSGNSPIDHCQIEGFSNDDAIFF